MPDDGQGLNRKPSDRDVDWEFTESFNKFVSGYCTPRARLFRSLQSLTGGEHLRPLPLPDRAHQQVASQIDANSMGTAAAPGSPAGGVVQPKQRPGQPRRPSPLLPRGHL